ncbi:MAG: isoleucine--tRNA ligase [Candidatus Magasanikbacteria bacterium]|nr:isoleucine--tRNA ligase [Candidatus Magasanikbacteria bacterium]
MVPPKFGFSNCVVFLFNSISMAYNAHKNEENIADFWEKESIFQKSIEQRSKDRPYVFYDGPPFATGLPHYGHIVGSILKDAISRYATMQGCRVERKWGWDCHGLPIENIVEKELETKSKKDIETLGVDVFNQKCRTKIAGFVDGWKKTMRSLGRWADMENAYKTMDVEYMESVWWVFKTLHENGYIYKGHRSMHVCPRCETTLSQQEVSEGYKTIKDISVTAKFKITSSTKEIVNEDADVYVLAWTTTPWTLPGNVLLAFGEHITYCVVKSDGAYYILAKDLVEDNFAEKEYEVIGEHDGKTFEGFTYEPLFPYYKETEKAFTTVLADFVTAEDGTGIVHIAPGFGDDDYRLAKAFGVPFVQHVSMGGQFVDTVVDFAGVQVKPIGDHMATDILMVKWLAHNGKLFSKKKYEHSYPHCWRCDTPLLNYATDSWFVAVTKIKAQALETAKNISWMPEHIKGGRFGKWLEGAKDWSISRQRFWASCIPVWECECKCGEQIVIGSIAELEKRSGVVVTDLHKDVLDPITFPCGSCDKVMRRVPDVLDCWFDAGSMPYAQAHYPFKNKEEFDKAFPANFVAEGIDQTRAWFYYLHILSNGVMGKNAVDNVVVNGMVLAEDGKKMSKKLQNYPDPVEVMKKYGADALRCYMLSSPVVHAEDLHFSEHGVRDMFNKTTNSLANVLSFYMMYYDEQNTVSHTNTTHVLDKWVLARLDETRLEVEKYFETYDLSAQMRTVVAFIGDLSQWYVRRSRERFKGLTHKEDAGFALATLKHVLLETSKFIAPSMPFIAEHIYQEMKKLDNTENNCESVHLELWSKSNSVLENKELLEQMNHARQVVELVLSLRKETKIKVRQPLAQISVSGVTLSKDLHSIILEEVNVHDCVQDVSSEDVVTKTEYGITVSLDTTITETLRKEGLLREIVRAINLLRKEQGFTVEDKVMVEYFTEDKYIAAVFVEYSQELQNQVLAESVVENKSGEVVEIEKIPVYLTVKKV